MNIHFRPAIQDDLPALINMLADDPLGAQRETISDPIDARYIDAFASIDKDHNNELIVVEHDGSMIGQLQLTFIPYLTYTGSWRCLVEGVRIHKDYRGEGLGEQLFKWAINRAKERDCVMIQLTTDKQRPEAIKFYEKLGFVASHEGMKLRLSS